MEPRPQTPPFVEPAPGPNPRLDFDLAFHPAPGGYLARVERSPAGPAEHAFVLPVLPDPGPGAASDPAARAAGEELFRAALGGEVGARLRASLELAAGQGAGLRLRLLLAADSEVADLPWELLFDPARGRFVALEAALVRCPEEPRLLRPLPLAPPLSVLAMIASPAGLPALDREREWERLNDALADLRGSGAVALGRLEEPTLRALHARLREEGCHALHFVGHAGLDPAGRPALLLEDEEGRPIPVSGGDLATILQSRRTLRLVALDAGESATAADAAPAGGVARDLLRAGVPAVVALRSTPAGPPPAAFLAELYGAVALGQPVDAAISRARLTAFAERAGAAWAAPALYLRAADGRVFEPEPSAPGEPVPLPPPEPSPPARPARQALRRALVALALAGIALALPAGYRWATRKPAAAGGASRELAGSGRSPVEDAAPAAPAEPGEAPPLTLAEIADRNREAKGGRVLLDSVYSLRIQGTLTRQDGVLSSFTIEAQRPDRFRLDFNALGRDASEVFDGQRGWKRDLGEELSRPMTDQELLEARARADFDELLENRHWEEAELLGQEKVGGRPCYRLEIAGRDVVTTAYVDAVTFLEAKVVRRPRGPGFEMETLLADYRQAGGLTFPFFRRMEERRPFGFRFGSNQRIVRIEVNADIPSERFAGP